MDADAMTDERGGGVRRRRVALTPEAGVKSAAAGLLRATVATEPVSPGRARYKPSTHRAGKAGCSPLNLYARVRFCHVHLHARPRVQRAPGLPCALSTFEGQRSMQTSDAMRRENACIRPSLRAQRLVRRSSTSEGGSDEAIHYFFTRRDGLLRGACHRARVRATRWLAMTARFLAQRNRRVGKAQRAHLSS